MQAFEDLVAPAVTVHQVHSAEIELISATEASALPAIEDYVTL